MAEQKRYVIVGVALLAIIIAMSSCASIISGKKAKITIVPDGSVGTSRMSEPVSITADGKTYRNVYLPYRLKVKRGHKPSNVLVRSENFTYDDLVIDKKINNTIWWNIALGGIIGIGVDAATGAMYKPESKIFMVKSHAKDMANSMSSSYAKSQEIPVVPAPVTTYVPKDASRVSTGAASPVYSRNTERPSALKTSNSFSESVSDVDSNIPYDARKNNNIYAIVIANENYQSEDKVPFAIHDGRTFVEYCNRTLEIPETNIDFFTDASFNNIRKAINNAKMFADVAGENAQIIFYYAGHGIPDEMNKSAYLLPVDGDGSDVVTGYKLDDLYAQLGALHVKNVTIFMDACFSGSKRDGSKLASARGVAIKVRPSAPQGNMLVFTASNGDETAYGYSDKSHGLFTYFLLKKLQETSGNVTYGELFDYIESNVKMKSFQVNRKLQTPTAVIAPAFASNWKNLQLKNN